MDSFEDSRRFSRILWDSPGIERILMKLWKIFGFFGGFLGF